MFGVSLLTLLLIVWAVITAVFITLMIWKTFAGMREDDQIFLDETEAKLAEEQAQIVAKVERITNWAKGFGIASAALLLVIIGVWIYHGFMTFSRPTMP